MFATRAPVRPNLIGLSLCKTKAVKDNVVEIETIDAFDGTPVLDLKPYAPALDSPQAVGPARGPTKPQPAASEPEYPPEGAGLWDGPIAELPRVPGLHSAAEGLTVVANQLGDRSPPLRQGWRHQIGLAGQ